MPFIPLATIGITALVGVVNVWLAMIVSVGKLAIWVLLRVRLFRLVGLPRLIRLCFP